MADGKITGRDVIDDSVLERLKEFRTELQNIIRDSAQISRAFKSSFGTSDIEKSVRATKELERATDELVVKTERTVAVEKERARLSSQEVRNSARLSQARSEDARNIARQRVAQREINKELAEEARLSSDLVGEYDKLKIRRDQAARTLRNLVASEKASNAELNRAQREFNELDVAVKKADQAAGNFRENVGNYPTAFRGAIASLRQLAAGFVGLQGLRLAFDFTREGIELERQARGIEFAFNRLGERGVQAFNDIKEATRGAFSDLQIRRSINEFENFNIPLEESGILFEFLAVRAAQTGKSIEDLSDSLVEGLSKESRLRIDNLGISVVALNEELEKTPNFVEAVANIARTEVAAAGDILDEAALGAQRFAAATENLQVQLGRAFGPIVSSSLDSFASLIKAIADNSEATNIRLEQSGVAVTGFRASLARVVDVFRVYSAEARAADAALVAFAANQRALLRESEIEAERLIRQFGSIFPLSQEQTEQLQENTEELLIYARTSEATAQSVGQIKDRIKELNDELDQATTRESASRIQAEIQLLEQQRDAILGIADAANESARQLGKVSGVEFAQGFKEALESAGVNLDPLIDAFDNSLAQATNESAQAINDFQNSVVTAEEKAQALAGAINVDTREAFRGLFRDLSSDTEINLDLFDKIIDGSEETKANVSDVFNTVTDLGQQLAFNQGQAIEREIEANRQRLQTINADERLSAEDRLRLQEEVQERERQLRIEQARQQKQQALVSIAIDTAQAIVRTLLRFSAIPGGIAAAGGTIAAITALGAAQAAVVAAQPLPQFFLGKGPLDNYEGLATWGERGQEVLVSKDGGVAISPNGTTLRHIKRDDRIYPNLKSFSDDFRRGGDAFTRLHHSLGNDIKSREFDYEYNAKMQAQYLARELRKMPVNITNKITADRRFRKW